MEGDGYEANTEIYRGAYQRTADEQAAGGGCRLLRVSFYSFIQGIYEHDDDELRVAEKTDQSIRGYRGWRAHH